MLRRVGWICWIVGFALFCVSFGLLLVLEKANVKAKGGYARFDADHAQSGTKQWRLDAEDGPDSPRAALVVKTRRFGVAIAATALLSLVLFVVCALPRETGPRIIAAVAISCTLFVLVRVFMLGLVGKALA